MRPQPGGRFEAVNVTVKAMITMAYRIRDFQLSGGPGWLDSAAYDITAKAEGDLGPDKTRLAMRALLADRFKLTLHSEQKELPLYALVVGKNGPKIQEAKREARSDDGGFRWGQGRISGQMVSLSDLADILSGVLKRPVADKTELKGLFDLKLNWTPDGYRPREGGSPNPNEPRPDPDGPTIFTAIQEQLGLRLESRKGPVEILVIDRVEKPAEN